jgi:hypothetical protein
MIEASPQRPIEILMTTLNESLPIGRVTNDDIPDAPDRRFRLAIERQFRDAAAAADAHC